MSAKPGILFVAHNSVLSPTFGGVEAYINTLTKYLSSEYDIYWYLPYFGDDGVGVQLIGPDKQSIKKILLKNTFENWQLSCPERETIFIKVLQGLDLSLVHFHHLAGHPPSLIRVAKEYGAKTFFTFHDYYSLCHISNLIDFEGKYCHPDQIPPSACDECLQKQYSILPGSQQIRRGYWNDLFQYIDGLIFNTKGSFNLVSKIYSSVASHPNVSILPVAIEEIVRPKMLHRTGDELRVAFLGNLNHHKGADVIIEVIEQLASENISFHFFGDIDCNYEEKLNQSKNSNIHRHGKFLPGEFPNELFLCDLSLHPSICPETYGLTLSEAWGAGLIPIVSDIGAFEERVINEVNGIKIKVNSSADLIEAILKIFNDQHYISKLQAPFSALPIDLMKEHTKKLITFYMQNSCALLKIPISTLAARKKYIVSWANFPHPTRTLKLDFSRLITRFKNLFLSLFK